MQTLLKTVAFIRTYIDDPVNLAKLESFICNYRNDKKGAYIKEVSCLEVY